MDAFATIQGGVNAVSNSGTVHVASGTYGETLVSGRTGLNIEERRLGNDDDRRAAQRRLAQHNARCVPPPSTTISGFTITRSGNNPTDWNSNVKAYGLNVSSSNGSLVRDCLISGNRNGLYMENNDLVTIRNSVIDNNRTGMHLVAINTSSAPSPRTSSQTTDRRQPPAPRAASNNTTGTRFVGNNITGNWYGQIEYREDGDASATPGQLVRIHRPLLRGIVRRARLRKLQIPTAFGGTAQFPAGRPGFQRV